MSKLKIELNKEGVRALLQSDEMGNICEKKAREIAKRAGSGYEVERHVGKRRAYANVRAVTQQAINDCHENNTLVKAMGG